jgi:hypothetical protein
VSNGGRGASTRRPFARPLRGEGRLPERARVVQVLTGDGEEVAEGTPLVETELVQGTSPPPGNPGRFNLRTDAPFSAVQRFRSVGEGWDQKLALDECAEPDRFKGRGQEVARSGLASRTRPSTRAGATVRRGSAVKPRSRAMQGPLHAGRHEP